MPFESVTPVLPAGAGRISDWVFPDYFAHSAAVPNQMRGRTSAADAFVSSGVTRGASPVNFNALNGVIVASFKFTNAGAGVVFAFANSGTFRVKTTKNNILPAVDDLCAKRLIATMALELPGPNAGQDYGAQFNLASLGGGTQCIIVNGNTGWGVQLLNATTAQFIVRGPNGLVTQNFALDTTQLHAYEFRIVDATPTVDAQLQFLIDNNIQALAAASSNWGPGTNLPPVSAISNLPGFNSMLANFGGVDNLNLHVQTFRCIQAPSLLMCN